MRQMASSTNSIPLGFSPAHRHELSESSTRKQKTEPLSTIPTAAVNHLRHAAFVDHNQETVCRILAENPGGFTVEDSIDLCHRINEAAGNQTTQTTHAADDPAIRRQCDICFLIAQRLLETTSATSLPSFSDGIEKHTDPQLVHDTLSKGIANALATQTDINTLQTCFGSYAITAAKFGFTDLLESLDEAGVDWAATNDQGCGPAHYAASRGHTELAQQLRELLTLWTDECIRDAFRADPSNAENALRLTRIETLAAQGAPFDVSTIRRIIELVRGDDSRDSRGLGILRKLIRGWGAAIDPVNHKTPVDLVVAALSDAIWREESDLALLEESDDDQSVTSTQDDERSAVSSENDEERSLLSEDEDRISLASEEIRQAPAGSHERWEEIHDLMADFFYGYGAVLTDERLLNCERWLATWLGNLNQLAVSGLDASENAVVIDAARRMTTDPAQQAANAAAILVLNRAPDELRSALQTNSTTAKMLLQRLHETASLYVVPPTPSQNSCTTQQIDLGTRAAMINCLETIQRLRPERS